MPVMAKRDYYEVLGVARCASEADFKAAFRKLAMQHPPTAIRATRIASIASRKSTRPTTFSRTSRSAPPTTGSATPPSSKAWAAARTASAAIFGSAFADIFEGIFGMGGARGRGTGRERGADLRFNMENHAGRGLRRQGGASPAARLGHLRGLLGHRRQGRHQAEDVPALQRQWPASAIPRAASSR